MVEAELSHSALRHLEAAARTRSCGCASTAARTSWSPVAQLRGRFSANACKPVEVLISAVTQEAAEKWERTGQNVPVRYCMAVCTSGASRLSWPDWNTCSSTSAGRSLQNSISVAPLMGTNSASCLSAGQDHVSWRIAASTCVSRGLHNVICVRTEPKYVTTVLSSFGGMRCSPV